MKNKPSKVRKVNYMYDQPAPSHDNIIRTFMSEVGNTPLLTASEEVLLAKRIEKGKIAKKKIMAKGLSKKDRQEFNLIIIDSKKAQDHLVLANSRLVFSVAKIYAKDDLFLMDLLQEGHIGLIRAAEKYDYKLGYRFSTYAKWWIWQTISRALANGKAIRIPVHLSDELSRMRNGINRLTQKLGRIPSEEEICSKLRISTEKYHTLIQVNREILSLDDIVKDDSNSTLGELISDENPSVESTVSNNQNKVSIYKGLVRLTAKEKEVIELIYGLRDGEVYTQSEIAQKLGLSKERIRQIHQAALEHLKTWAINNDLSPE